MRNALGLICCLPLFSADLAEIRQLEETRRMFELRRQLAQQVSTAPESRYFRALIAARFGREAIAVEQLREFLATGAEPLMQCKAHEELASALARLGQYRNAASEWTEVLRLTSQDDPDRPGTENTRLIYDSLRDVPSPTVEFGRGVPVQAEHNPFGSWSVPVEVNGKKGEWGFDTGANISTLTESEAVKMGLAVRDVSASVVSNHTGKQSALRLAVANDLNLGSAHLHNVIFLVLADTALQFGKYEMRGLLGLPVLRALVSVGISANGTVRIQRDPPNALGEPNLFFDGLSMVLQVSHNGRTLQMLLDTGANKGYLYPSFRDALASEELRTLKRRSATAGGAGGIIRQVEEILPALQLQIAGRDIRLKNVSLRQEQPTGTDAYYNGLVGQDALRSGFMLDFKAMQLRLD